MTGPAERAAHALREGLVHADQTTARIHEALDALKPLVLEERVERLRTMPEMQVLLMQLKALSPADIELVVSKWTNDLKFIEQIQERQRGEPHHPER